SRKRVKGTKATFSYSLFCYRGCSTTRYGFLFLVIEMRKAATYLLTRVLNLNKLTESKIAVTHPFAEHIAYFIVFFFGCIKLADRDDQILLNGIAYYLFSSMVQRASHSPIWKIDGNFFTTGFIKDYTTITFTLATILTTIPQLSHSL
ncbi:hypothetical protein CFP56_021493, partial [Quercus suber]